MWKLFLIILFCCIRPAKDVSYVTVVEKFSGHRRMLLCVYEQKKLEGELQLIEEKHRAKKCKFAESSEQFYEQLARVIYSQLLVYYIQSFCDFCCIYCIASN